MKDTGIYVDKHGTLLVADQCEAEHTPADPRCDYAPQQRPVLTLIKGGQQ